MRMMDLARDGAFDVILVEAWIASRAIKKTSRASGSA